MTEQDPQATKVNRLILGNNTLELLGVEQESDIEIITPWDQGGTETYVTDFLITKPDEKPIHLIAKACIKFSPREVMADWLSRRELLSENNVLTPELVTLDEKGSTLVEEFIPFSFREAYYQADETNKENLRQNFIQTYLRVVGIGFSPVSLYDVRSHGKDVVVVDFGSDLGGPRAITYCNMDAYIKAEKDFRSTIPRG